MRRLVFPKNVAQLLNPARQADLAEGIARLNAFQNMRMVINSGGQRVSNSPIQISGSAALLEGKGVIPPARTPFTPIHLRVSGAQVSGIATFAVDILGRSGMANSAYYKTSNAVSINWYVGTGTWSYHGAGFTYRIASAGWGASSPNSGGEAFGPAFPGETVVAVLSWNDGAEEWDQAVFNP